ncbi:OmpA family protein [Hydrogenobacter sp. T-2]|uniref:OmpA family protein n=1 Tax=Pampinifervens diazotrophicum TaxID=1632018 RepID=UPI002B25A584|nr:OmpA family protein [Hydrogenobacter sp. T-2]WPM32733.1 OmpA family protein [Hydrogenobacter sp. T-2]
MKRFVLLVVSSTVLFAQDFSNMRLLEGLNQVQKGIELAKREEADKKGPYHFEKAKANRDVAKILASEMDEVGSRVFMIKSFNALSKAGSGKLELDSIEFITQTEIKKVKRVEYGEYGEPLYYDEEEGSKIGVEYQKALGLDISSLNAGLEYIRENKAISCAPAELARAEVYYDAMAYELSKPRPHITRLVDFYSKAQAEINSATEKVNIAKEGNLECYTGKPFVPELAKVEEPTIRPTLTPIPSRIQEEPLMVTARVHFDFNKSNIKREYIPLLNEVVKVLKENPNVRVRIEGFTDDIGSKAYNDRLALRRAQAVRDYLVRAGIPADRIEVAGFGKERYIADNATPIGRFTNRRAEFIVIQVPGQ